jgi:hypothetical protein
VRTVSAHLGRDLLRLPPERQAATEQQSKLAKSIIALGSLTSKWIAAPAPARARFGQRIVDRVGRCYSGIQIALPCVFD